VEPKSRRSHEFIARAGTTPTQSTVTLGMASHVGNRGTIDLGGSPEPGIRPGM
jgi:hypothetical protein